MSSGAPGPRAGLADEQLHTGDRAPSFDHNPSSMRHRHGIAAIALVAVAIALYMGLYQWGVIDSVWDPVFGSGTQNVLQSSASDTMKHVLGIPDAILGAWAYLTEVTLCFVGSTRRWQFRPWIVVLFGLDVFPLGIVSVTLVILQGILVGAWCFPCLVTASLSLVLVFLAWDEVWASVRYLKAVWVRYHDRGLLWDTFRGVGSDRAYAVAMEMQP